MRIKTLKKLKIPEKQVLKAVLQFLDFVRIFHWRNNTGAVTTDKRFIRFGAAGSPDIIAIYQGRFIGIECKSSTGRQTAAQKQFQIAVEASKGIYILAKKVEDVADVIDALRLIGRRRDSF